MKRIIMIGLLTAVIALPSQAQELKKVMVSLQLGKLADAKTEIDKNAADPKFSSKAETYYWKSRIYAAIYKDPVFRAKTPNAKEIAEEAFAKYQQLDPSYNFVLKSFIFPTVRTYPFADNAKHLFWKLISISKLF